MKENKKKIAIKKFLEKDISSTYKEYFKDFKIKSTKIKKDYGTLKKFYLLLLPKKYCLAPDCNKESSFAEYGFYYNEYCSSKCKNKHKWTEESKQSASKKRKEYYHKNPEALKERNLKISKSNKKVWGVNTKLRKSQTQKMKKTFKTGLPVKKARNTKLKKYNNENYNNPEKLLETCQERYGVKNPRQIKGMSKKIEETFLRKYGYKNNFSNPEIYKKAINSKRKKYLENINLEDKELYYYLVLKETKKQNIKTLKHFDKRGRLDNNKEAYHLDHKFSIIKGFEECILPIYIGNINNLEFIPAIENCSKSKKCTLEIKELEIL